MNGMAEDEPHEIGDPNTPQGVVRRAAAEFEIYAAVARQMIAHAADDEADLATVRDRLRVAALVGHSITTDIAARGAAVDVTGQGAVHDLLDDAERVVAEADLLPHGRETTARQEYFRRLQRSTAILLAGLWTTGRLIGPLPVEAWPNTDLAWLIMRTLEDYADLWVDIDLP